MGKKFICAVTCDGYIVNNKNKFTLFRRKYFCNDKGKIYRVEHIKIASFSNVIDALRAGDLYNIDFFA